MGATDRRWRWRWRRSPLRRRWDVMDAWLGLLVTVALVLAVPAAGTLTALAAHSSLAATAAEDNRHRHPVQAVLLETASRTPPPSDIASGRAGYEARVRWTAPDGRPHTAFAGVRPGQRQGTYTTVWTDDNGQRSRPPVGSAEIIGNSLTDGLTTATALALTLLGTRWAVRSRLDRKRLEAWERDWAEVGPRWGHKHT